MKEEARRVQIGISVVSGLAIIVHLIWPELSIDGVTLTLLAFAILPWLAPLLKALELPGGWKVEFQDLLQRQREAEEAGLLADQKEGGETTEHTFLSVAGDDPNLALAGLRIEIEQRLKRLAEQRGIDFQRVGAGQLLRRLHNSGAFTDRERGVLADLIGTLNMAVHGAEVPGSATNWALEVGPRILQGLESRLATFERLSARKNDNKD